MSIRCLDDLRSVHMGGMCVCVDYCSITPGMKCILMIVWEEIVHRYVVPISLKEALSVLEQGGPYVSHVLERKPLSHISRIGIIRI